MSFTLLGILNSQAAAGGAGAYDLLETEILASDAASVTFTGLGAYTDYKHLQLRMVLKEDANTFPGASNMRMIINSDTGTNYARHELRGDGSSVNSFSGTSQSALFFSNIQRAGTDSNTFTPSVIDILDFSSTSKNKTFRALYGTTSSGNNSIFLQSGLYISTSAMTSIEMSDNSSSNFVSGSRFSLYGVK